MTQSNAQSRQTEKGFTLVELAIVMIIIGLLIGGILKGQELINNARLSSTVSQAKAVESGVSGFRDKYGAFPGDIVNPVARVVNCAASTVCSGAAAPGVGNGDGFVQTGTANDPGAAAAFGQEAAAALAQLGAAGFVGGMRLTGNTLGAGISHPETPLGGVWNFGYSNGVVNATGDTGTALALLPGHYISANATPGAAASTTVGPYTPAQAASIDRKIDDGHPNVGSVRATGAIGAANCALSAAATAADIYNEGVTGNFCGLFVKVQ